MSPSVIQVLVHNMSGQEIELAVGVCEKLHAVQKLIEVDWQIPCCRQSLIHGTTILDEDAELSSLCENLHAVALTLLVSEEPEFWKREKVTLHSPWGPDVFADIYLTEHAVINDDGTCAVLRERTAHTVRGVEIEKQLCRGTYEKSQTCIKAHITECVMLKEDAWRRYDEVSVRLQHRPFFRIEELPKQRDSWHKIDGSSVKDSALLNVSAVFASL